MNTLAETELTEFYSSIEDLLKLIEMKIDRKQAEDASRLFVRLDEIFFRVHELRKKNTARFLHLFYQPKFFNEVVKYHSEFPNIRDPYALTDFNWRRDLLRFDTFYNDLHWELFMLFRDSRNQKLEIKSLRSLINKVAFLSTLGLKIAGETSYLTTILKIHQYHVSLPYDNDYSLSQLLSSHRWFYSVVFYNKKFDVRKIEEIIKFLVHSLHITINANKIELFKDFIDSTLKDYAVVPSTAGATIPYGFLKRNLGADYPNVSDIDHAFYELRHQAYHLDTSDGLSAWHEKLGKVRATIKDAPTVVVKATDEIENYGKQCFLYNKLRQAVAVVAIYSLFKRKYEFIEHLFTANQPMDAVAHQLNRDINPSSLRDLFNLLSHDHSLEDLSLTIWDGQHGFEPYFKQYLIVSLASICRYQGQRARENFAKEISAFLSQKKSITELEIINSQWDSINRPNKVTEQILIDLGFSQKVIENILKPVIVDIGRSIERNLSIRKAKAPISNWIKARFVLLNYQAFMKASHLRCIFVKMNVSSVNEENTAPSKSIESIVKDLSAYRNLFVPDIKNESYVGFDEFGRHLGMIDNSKIFSFIVNSSKSHQSDDLVEVRRKIDECLDDGFIILGRNVDEFEDILGSKDFVSIYDVGAKFSSKLSSLTGFAGIYQEKYEVINFYDQSFEKSILMFNPSALEKISNYHLQDPPLKYAKKFFNAGYSLEIPSENAELALRIETENPGVNVKQLVSFAMGISSVLSLKASFQSYYFLLPRY